VEQNVGQPVEPAIVEFDSSFSSVGDIRGRAEFVEYFARSRVVAGLD
jgi:hypothetical protein